jgi:peptidoglycan/LPS O-acetylase OafA/YrhL
MFPQRPAIITKSAPARRDPALDGLRGIAILMVFFFHYGGGMQSHHPLVKFFGLASSTGWVGVQLFFALSGFLITGSIWESIHEKFMLRNFFVRRALRILPLYGIALLISGIGAFILGANASTIKAFLIYCFMLQDIPYLSTIAQFYYDPYPLYHLWSIAVEEQFYLFFPALLLAVDNRRGARRLCIRLFAFSAFFRLIVCLPELSSGRELYYTNFVITHMGGFALGGAVAMALRSRDSASGKIASPVRYVRRFAGYTFWSGLLVFLGIGLYEHSFVLSLPLMFMFGLPAITLAAAALIPILLRDGLPRNLFSLAPLVWLGRISYGVYVFHILLQPWIDAITVALTRQWWGDVYQLVRMCVALPLAIVVAAFSFRFIEQPILALGKRFPMHSAVPVGLKLASEVSPDRVRARQIHPDPAR